MANLHKLTGILATLAGLVLAPAASAFEYELVTDGSSYDLTPLADARSAATFYSNEFYHRAKSVGDPDIGPEEDTALFYLYEDTSSGDISLGVVLDAPDGVNGRAYDGDLDMLFSGLPAGASVSFSDDGGEFSMIAGSAPDGTRSAQGDWAWLDCCTDGGVLSGLSGTWETTAEMLNFSQLDSFYFLTGSASNPQAIAMDLEVGESFVVRAYESTEVPTPAPLALMAAGIAGAWWRRRG